MYHTKHRNRNTFKGLFPTIDNIINEVANAPFQDLANETAPTTSRPKANVIEFEDRYEIAIAMPGFTKKDVSIQMEKDKLTVSAEKESSSDIKYNLKEFTLGKMKRTFRLPEYINRSEIGAEFNNGILSIQLKKAEDVKPKTITIK